MAIFERLYAIPSFRKAVWRLWYPFVTWRLHREGVTFLNYAFETDPPTPPPLDPEDEPHRASVQLYHHVAGQLPPSEWVDRDALEISCGHGGGASYLARTLRPRTYTAMDLNPAAIRFCRGRHHATGLRFVRGDAEALPFPDASFDVVLNVEASHCYADFPRFLAEVARVLRPGGHFLYADFRDHDGIPRWEQTFTASSLRALAFRDISAEVLRGMDRNSSRSRALIRRHLPLGFRTVGGDFAGIQGSRTYNALKARTLAYRSGCFARA